MGKENAAVFFYGTAIGRILLKCVQKLRLDVPMAAFLQSRASKALIKPYIKRHGIDMKPFAGQTYKSFGAFFARKRPLCLQSGEDTQLISPCDALVSTYKVDENAVLTIKGSHYQVGDLLGDATLIEQYREGLCLVFRLCPSDYHHYCYIDNGYQKKSHFIEGVLHSVQPIACATYPVFVLNRRVWSLMETEHFGEAVQTEIGALMVGGIVNEKTTGYFKRGEEKGHFELAGSTITLLFQKEKVKLFSFLEESINTGKEFRVAQGEIIGSAVQAADCVTACK
ncbi:MAG: phosphatidylserine decarboxylase [Clostridia bacterium]|nr:phosphatidylserine decarboxylase [Clostridia bacterium]